MGEIVAERYRLEQELGTGAMGSVWRAVHLTLGHAVAIKLIKESAARNPRSLARFEREAPLVAKINSAHVVRVIDHGHHQELPFIVMEYLVGQDLRSRLEARMRLGLQETALVIKHVCRALAAAHAVGLVHRDIKPENIFLTPGEDPGAERAVVLDFGIAKASDALAGSTLEPTQTGAVVGTPYYLSPEQAQGLRSLGPSADMWSLAVVAFECITGQRPFSAPSLGPLFAMISHGPIPLPSQLLPGIPATIDAWFGRALTRDPGGRFSDAQEMAHAFFEAAALDDPQPTGRHIPAQQHTFVIPDAGTTIGLHDPSQAQFSDEYLKTLALPDREAPTVPTPPAHVFGSSPTATPTVEPRAVPAELQRNDRSRAAIVVLVVAVLLGVSAAAGAYLVLQTPSDGTGSPVTRGEQKRRARGSAAPEPEAPEPSPSQTGEPAEPGATAQPIAPSPAPQPVAPQPVAPQPDTPPPVAPPPVAPPPVAPQPTRRPATHRRTLE